MSAAAAAAAEVGNARLYKSQTKATANVAVQVFTQPWYAFVESTVYRYTPKNFFTHKEFVIRIPGVGALRLTLFRLVWRSLYVCFTTGQLKYIYWFNCASAYVRGTAVMTILALARPRMSIMSCINNCGASTVCPSITTSTPCSLRLVCGGTMVALALLVSD